MSHFIPADIMEGAMASDIHWKTAYKTVEDATRNLFTALPPGTRLTTKALAAELYKGANDFTIQRIFSALKANASHGLAEYWEPGEVRKAFGKPGSGKIWRAPTAPLKGSTLDLLMAEIKAGTITQGAALEALHNAGEKFMSYAEQVSTNDDLEVDDKPLFSKSDDGGVWVAAWIFVRDPE